MPKQATGQAHITHAFQQAQKEQVAALMPYFTLGYPDEETSLAIIEAIAPFCDLIELGVPFSDPLADGPTIQRSTQTALEKGTTVTSCLQMVSKLHQRGVQIPLLLMGYYNPILAYGQEKYVRDAAAAGAAGFIVPDLPPEEADPLHEMADQAGLCLVHFLAPTSQPARIKMVAERATGFIYLVSVTGVTGARTNLETDLSAFVARVREEAAVPLAIGFGISTPAQARQIGDLAEGVIVGSALINATDDVEQGKPQAAASYVKSLRAALLQ